LTCVNPGVQRVAWNCSPCAFCSPRNVWHAPA